MANPIPISSEPPEHMQAQVAGDERAMRREVHVPVITFLKIFAALILGYSLYLLWPLFLLVLLALLLAVTLNSAVGWLESHGLKHWQSLLAVIGGLLLMLGGTVALILPALYQQIAGLGQTLPALRDGVLNHLPAGGAIRGSAEHLMQSPSWAEAGTWLSHCLSMGGAVLNGLSQVLLFLVIAIYLLVDGGKTYEWILAFFSAQNRQKMRLTSREVSKVIFGYVSGQVLTSVLVAVYSFAVLTLLHVPGALLLASIAGIFDILPVLGFVMSTVPTVLAALSVDPRTALTVLGLYVLFHGLEVYFIIPKVYGKSLRLSTLTVLLGLLAGTLLAGVPGALAALPVIASYDAVERIWLKPLLRGGVVEKHEMQKAQEFG